jgi:hypothetical protein
MHHLHVLHLDENASQNDIRAAYRRLSKKYHPDVNSSAAGVERFIEIKEAYDYLIKNPAISESISAEPMDIVRERWKAEARMQASRRAEERERLRGRLFKQIRLYVNPVIWIITAFNILLVIDYLLPRQSYAPEFIRIERYETRVNLFTEKHSIELDEDAFGEGQAITNLRVTTTPILESFIDVKADINNEPQKLQPRAGVYAFFGYLIPMIFLSSFVYFRFHLGLENQITLAFFIVILAVIQVVLIASFIH